MYVVWCFIKHYITLVYLNQIVQFHSHDDLFLLSSLLPVLNLSKSISGFFTKIFSRIGNCSGVAAKT